LIKIYNQSQGWALPLAVNRHEPRRSRVLSTAHNNVTGTQYAGCSAR
jgi:hypothetical protein